MSLYHLEWVFRYLPVVLIVFTKVNHSHKVQKYVIIPRGVGIKIPTLGPYSFYKGKSQSQSPKSMSLYQVEWVFRYLPVVLTVFTKVNHSHKVQKYVIIPRGVGIKIPTLGPYSFYKGKSQS